MDDDAIRQKNVFEAETSFKQGRDQQDKEKEQQKTNDSIEQGQKIKA